MFAFASLQHVVLRQAMLSECEDEVVQYGPFLPREGNSHRMNTAVRTAGGCRTPAVIDDLDDESESASLTVAMSELLEEEVGFEIRDSELPFIEKGEHEGELVGYLTLDVAKGAQVEESEPLTCGEVVRLMELLFGEEENCVRADFESSPTVCQQVLCELVEHIEELAGESVETIRCEGAEVLEEKHRTYLWKTMREPLEDGKFRVVPQPKQLMPLEQRMLKWLPQMEEKGIWRRIKNAAVRQNVSDNWSYQDRWFFGEREGITHSQAEQNDVQFTKLEQYEDDDLHSQLEKARSTNLYKELFYQGGEELSASRRGDGEEKRTRAKRGENRQHAEFNRYLWRKSHSRGEEFAKALWKVLTYPLTAVEKYLVDEEGREGGVLRKKYNDSVKQAAPGPGRKNVGGKWLNTPAEGALAVLELKRRGFDATKLSRPKRGNKSLPISLKGVRFHKGAQWECIWIDSEQMKTLEEAIKWRLERKHYQGLPGVRTVGEKLEPASIGEYAELVLASAMRYRMGENNRQV